MINTIKKIKITFSIINLFLKVLSKSSSQNIIFLSFSTVWYGSEAFLQLHFLEPWSKPESDTKTLRPTLLLYIDRSRHSRSVPRAECFIYLNNAMVYVVQQRGWVLREGACSETFTPTLVHGQEPPSPWRSRPRVQCLQEHPVRVW